MRHKIICISRSFGSGGHEIGVTLAERLGIPLYEKDIFRLACRFGELREEAMEGADEKATNPLLFTTVHDGNHHVARGLPTTEVLFRLQSHEIARLAQEEDCIFIGRCADYVLRDAEVKLLRVFVTAPVEDRIRRKIAQENLKPGPARRLVRRMDRQRQKYYESYTSLPWGDPSHYDLVIDTAQTPIPEAVELLAARYEAL